MNIVKLALSITTATLAIISIQACTPKTAGVDSAYLNKNRGAAGAQISKAEAEQYSRQQGLTADEIRLENMKRHQTTDAIQEGASATKSAVGAIDSVKGLLNSF
ncbi:hypothetical protein MNB_SV-12-1546 [hydrothermal vent metagenome]|uniref:Lipoprotein n=1 Tax=hydrothermal vent metagenome TaxID=652676 RepID=A0A1W1C8J3_9ZZZZ